MKVLIINNLVSGRRDGGIFDFMRMLSRDRDELVVRNTDGTTPVETLLDDAHAFDLVVVSGGDGTIASACYCLRGTGLPILPFPAGTGNLLVANLEQPEYAMAISNMARSPVALDFDLGEICFNGVDGPATKGFAVIAGAGFDAAIMENAQRLKENLGITAYVAAALANPQPAVAHFTITLDDRTIECDGIAALVLNFAKIYPDISITHENDARDGLFEVVIVKPHNTVELLPALVAAFLDRTGGFPGRTDALEIHTGRRVRVESDPPLHIQHDGEPTGATTPFTAEVLPNATRLVVTEEVFERLSLP